jgi:hypothetical protein
MTLFVITYLPSPGEVLYVETAIARFCLFTKYPSRAHLFPENIADELLVHLKAAKAKHRDRFFKQPYDNENEGIHSYTVRPEEKN